MVTRIVERDHTSDPTAPGPEPPRRARMPEGGHPGTRTTLSSPTQVACDGGVGRRGRFRGRRTSQLHRVALHPDIQLVSADGRARPRPNTTVVDEMRPVGDVADLGMVESDEALDHELMPVDREQQQPDLAAARLVVLPAGRTTRPSRQSPPYDRYISPSSPKASSRSSTVPSETLIREMACPYGPGSVVTTNTPSGLMAPMAPSSLSTRASPEPSNARTDRCSPSPTV